jgi:phosphotransferase system HPr (HPr) family protein
MAVRTTTITSSVGLHARPAALLAKAAAASGHSVSITVKGRTADAKSLLSVLGLAAAHGDVLVITHGTVLGSILREIDPEHRPRAGFPNCGIVPVTDGVIGGIDASCRVE